MEKRGVKEGQEYAILTAEISKATFGMTPSEYQKLKGLKRENLRDHMNDLELIFSMLGEASTTEIARNKDTQGFIENKIAAKEGGAIAGDARKKLEIKSGKTVRLAIPAAKRTGHWRTDTVVFCWTRMRPPSRIFNFSHSSPPQSGRGVLADSSKKVSTGENYLPEAKKARELKSKKI